MRVRAFVSGMEHNNIIVPVNKSANKNIGKYIFRSFSNLPPPIKYFQTIYIYIYKVYLIMREVGCLLECKD